MPTLDWIGKSKVINHHQDVPFRVLERQYSFDESGQHEEDNGSGNMIIHGDNLEALKALLPRYEGRVKCIYIDPPYNTGNEGWVYNDNVNDPKIRKWLGEVVGKEDEDLTRHDKWLCMMYPRLVLLKKLLSDDGVFFASIGDDELPTLLLLVKEIFGSYNAIFVWRSRTKPTNAGRAKYRPQKVTEYVIMFTRDGERTFNIGSKEDEYSYPNHDEHGNYRTSTILTSNLGSYKRETMRFTVAGYTPPPDKRWKAGIDVILEKLENNRLLFNDEGVPMEKVYDYDNSEVSTPLYTNIDVKVSGTAESGKTCLNRILGMGHGFDTVKPCGLIQYLLGLVTEPGDIVLDSFAGTGTTAHALLEMNAKDEGGRQFIMVEMGDYANSITAERVKRVICGYSYKEAKGSKPVDVDGTGGNFSYYELGERMMTEDGNLNEAAGLARIREYIWYMETRRELTGESNGNPHYLGSSNGTAYYFVYSQDEATVLDFKFLATIPEREEHTVIYADSCIISEDELLRFGITFKKIPRDITKL